MTSVKRKLDDELSSPWFYTVCTMGGMISAGTTHLAITPLDVLKVNMQVSFLDFLKWVLEANSILILKVSNNLVCFL